MSKRILGLFLLGGVMLLDYQTSPVYQQRTPLPTVIPNRVDVIPESDDYSSVSVSIQASIKHVETPMDNPPSRMVSLPRSAIEKLIYNAAKKWGINAAQFLAVARCESGLNPRAINPTGCEGHGCFGVFQHHGLYWRSRFDKAGWEDSSWSDPRANIDVAARLWKAQGAGPWGSCAARAGAL